MKIKSIIKNDLWKYSYVLPFVRKDIAATKNKLHLLKCLLSSYSEYQPIKGKEAFRSVGSDTLELLSVIDIDILSGSRFVYFIDEAKTIAVKGNVIDNFTFDYSKIINMGFSQLAAKVEGDDEYGREVRLIKYAVERLRDRIVNYLKANPDENLISERKLFWFENMLERPAEHFDEALQRILYFNQILWQTRHRLNGLGRLDKMLDSLYKRDIDKGYIKADEVEDIIADFLKQLARYHDYKSTALYGDIGQIIILGGIDRNGLYFYNDLTRIFLCSQAKLRLPDPKTILRVSKEIPDELIDISVKCLKSSTGSPLFSNDDVVIPALCEMGIEETDAYEYCTSACWEPFIVGKSFDQNNMVIFDYNESLDIVLKRFRNRKSITYDELIKAYRRENERNAIKCVKEAESIKWAKDPLVSLCTDGCNEIRKDISEGGAKYNNYGITTVGIANVVDSLLTIKDLVYDRKKYSLSRLEKEREDDFPNNKIFNELHGHKKYFGHDIEEASDLTNTLTLDISSIMNDKKNKLGGLIKSGLSSPDYIKKAQKAKADFSGRKKGQPYTTHISAREVAYTELVNFASQLDYTKGRCNGNVVDFFLPSSFIDSNMDKFALFIKGAIKQGFFQMQMNIMDSKTLIEAKKNPQNYENLIVRVWGFSAYFVRLPEEYQDVLIKRALEAENIAYG